MTTYHNDERLADMVQGLFCEILEEPCKRPRNFEESFHLLSVLKRRGLEKRLAMAAKINDLERKPRVLSTVERRDLRFALSDATDYSSPALSRLLTLLVDHALGEQP